MFGTMNRQNHQNPMNQFDSTQMPYAAQSYPSHHRFYRESQSQLFAEKHPVLPDISFLTVGDKDAAYALENPDCKSAALPRNVLNADGQRMVEIPDFESMTMFMMRKDGADQRKPIYDYLNQQLRLGRLARIVGFPVLNRCIDGAACNLKRFNYWELSRNEFYADIEVELNLMTHGGVQTWKGVLVCYCCFGDEFEMTIEELRTSIDRREEGWVPLDPFLIQVYNGAQIDYEAELMWTRHQLQDALTDPKKRKARKLAKKLGLKIMRLPIYEHKGLNSILFFEEGTLIVGTDRVEEDEDGHKIIFKDDHGEPVRTPANTIVINSNRVEEEYEDFPIFHECYHFEKHYLAFRLQKLTCNDTRIIKRKLVPVDPDMKNKDYLFLMERQADRGASALWMPASDTRNRINARLSQIKLFKHDGERFEIVGISVSYQLSVPHFRMRARMIQLGYPQAKGIMHYVEHRRIRPFAFDPESLRAEELTFFITPAKIESPCKESAELKAVLKSKRYVYAEGHLVYNDPRFVRKQGSEYKLTDFAIANVDACCLRFVQIYVQKNLGHYVLGQMYMDAEYVERTLFYLNDLLKNPELNDFKAKQSYKMSFPTVFKDAVDMLKNQNPGATYSKIAEFMCMDDSTLKRALTDPKKYKNEDFVMMLCLYFKLPDWISELLFKRAAHVHLDQDDERHAAMLEILRSRSCDGLEAAQAFMKDRGVDPLNWA